MRFESKGSLIGNSCGSCVVVFVDSVNGCYENPDNTITWVIIRGFHTGGWRKWLTGTRIWQDIRLAFRSLMSAVVCKPTWTYLKTDADTCLGAGKQAA